MALTPDPAGTVATRLAGLVDFRATLSWDGDPAPEVSCLPATDPSFRHDLRQGASSCGAGLEVRGTIRALTPSDLGAAVERAMRAAGDAAALTGAVLEMHSSLKLAPRAADPALVQGLAFDLREAGFRVAFAPCWEPEGACALAVGGGRGIPDFLAHHAVWGPA